MITTKKDILKIERILTITLILLTIFLSVLFLLYLINFNNSMYSKFELLIKFWNFYLSSDIVNIMVGFSSSISHSIETINLRELGLHLTLLKSMWILGLYGLIVYILTLHHINKYSTALCIFSFIYSLAGAPSAPFITLCALAFFKSYRVNSYEK